MIGVEPEVTDQGGGRDSLALCGIEHFQSLIAVRAGRLTSYVLITKYTGDDRLSGIHEPEELIDIALVDVLVSAILKGLD